MLFDVSEIAELPTETFDFGLKRGDLKFQDLDALGLGVVLSWSSNFA
jgi:hypothetical protein